MGGPNWMTLRSYSRDQSVKEVRLAPGTIRRIIGFARPYRRLVGVFLALVIVDAVLVVATPLLLKTLVDDGVLRGDRTLVTLLALVVAGLAILDAVFALAQRW